MINPFKQTAIRKLVIVAFALLIAFAALWVWAEHISERQRAEKRNWRAPINAARMIVTALEDAATEERDLEITPEWIADLIGDVLIGERYRVSVVANWREVIRDDCEGPETIAAVERLYQDGRRQVGAVSCMGGATTRIVGDDIDHFMVFLIE